MQVKRPVPQQGRKTEIWRELNHDLLIQVSDFSPQLQGCLCNWVYVFASESLCKNGSRLCIYVLIYIYICMYAENIF